MALGPLDLNLNYLPSLPVRRDFRIGVIGSGFIVRDCHLVAYRNAGFKVIAIASRTPEHARAVAAEHAIPNCYADYRELLDDDAVAVVDIAVPPDRQLAVVRDVVVHNDHVRGVLAQKPLAISYEEARQIVQLCDRAG